MILFLAVERLWSTRPADSRTKIWKNVEGDVRISRRFINSATLTYLFRTASEISEIQMLRRTNSDRASSSGLNGEVPIKDRRAEINARRGLGLCGVPRPRRGNASCARARATSARRICARRDRRLPCRKSFEPPLDVRRCPGTQPVALCCDPVVVQRVEHESRQGNMAREFQENRTVKSDCAAQKERAEPEGSALFFRGNCAASAARECP